MNIRNTALAALIFVLIYNILFFHTGFGIGTTLFVLLLNVYFFLTKNINNKNLNLAVFSSVLSILFAFLLSFRGNGIIQIIDLTLSIFFSSVALYLYKSVDLLTFRFLNFILIPFLVVERSISSLFSLFNKEKDTGEPKEKNSYAALIRGFLITLPIFAVLLILLTSADPIFGKFTQDIFKNIGERSVISAILFTVLIGLGLSKFLPKAIKDAHHNISADKAHELYVIAGSIIGLFAIFIIIQFRYLFMSVGEGELHQIGITSLTYSEYVRKGFFELLVAAVIASGVIVYIFKYLHHLKDQQKQLLQIFSTMLTVETGLLLLSDVKRLVLYADAHGLTRARVFGFIFLLWLSTLLVIFLIRVFKEMKEKEFFISTAFITLVAFISINMINIDGLIAEQYKPTVNGEIDYYYLTSLSVDAKYSWKESIADAEQIVIGLENLPALSAEDNRKLYWVDSTITQLDTKIDYLIDKYGTLSEIRSWHKDEQGTYKEVLRAINNEEDLPEDIRKDRKWQSFNFAQYSAYRSVIDNINYFEKIANLSQRLAQLRNKVSEEVQRNTRLDRSTNPPLLR